MSRRIIVFALLFIAGCHRSSGVSSAPAQDYRKMSQAEIANAIKDKLRAESVTLTADGPNRFKGTMPSPDGTVQLPIEVVVEASQIVVTSKAGGFTARHIITPDGLETDLR